MRTLGRRVVEVITGTESVACGAVVNAAGPWAGEVARLATIDLPVTALRRQVAVTVPTAALPEANADDNFRRWFPLPRPGPARPFASSQPPRRRSIRHFGRPTWVDSVLECGRGRVPALHGIPVASAYAGLYEMSPDEHAIVGFAESVENFLLVNGSSGHGVMHSPALGQLAAELLTLGAEHGASTSMPCARADFERDSPTPFATCSELSATAPVPIPAA